MGLCREHSNRVNTKVESLESLEGVRKALAETDKKSPTRVCYGGDATVVAIAPYANEKHYTAVPIVASPTDKTETGAAFAEWLDTVIDAWRLDPNGEKIHGPIWSIESDGDSAFRLAKFITCMVKPIDPNSELGKILEQCVGINKYTSKHGAIAGSDLKHVAKRMYSMFILPRFRIIQNTSRIWHTGPEPPRNLCRRHHAVSQRYNQASSHAVAHDI
jgi:hypothetical protein